KRSSIAGFGSGGPAAGQHAAFFNGQFTNRIQDRITASLIGLRELDMLREKHRKIFEDIKCYMTCYSNCRKFNENEHEHFLPLLDAFNVSTFKCPPSPSYSLVEMSSGMSHRSSLSMDSGCMSLASDAASFNNNVLSAPGADILFSTSLPPSRKNSSSTNITSDSGHFFNYQNVAKEDHTQEMDNYSNTLRGYSKSLGVKKRINNSINSYNSTVSGRPKSLYSYPEENTVIVEEDRIKNKQDLYVSESSKINDGRLNLNINEALYKASKVYIDQPPPSPPVVKPLNMKSVAALPAIRSLTQRRARPVSMAVPDDHAAAHLAKSLEICLTNSPPPPSALQNRRQSPNQKISASKFTWDEVKRLLDPGFEHRGKILRHQSTTNVSLSSCGHNLNNFNANRAGRTSSIGSPKNCGRSTAIVRSSTGTLPRKEKFLAANFEAVTETTSPVSSRNSSCLVAASSSALTTPTVAKKSFSPKNNGPSSSNATRSSTMGHRTLSTSSTNSEQHTVISRTASNQSTDSSKSSKSRKKEKSWHESEGL
uniref:Uncharacterized protein n=1 Tax=Romanomermis culicivorax TaxID=13658 RepID=A0A915KKZ9_ROMCU